MEEVVLEAKNITKFFPPNILANYRINFSLRKGEVHVLLGENGAGKSTLARILYGECKPDEGEIYVRGRRVVLKSPRDAIKHGIGMVHQHFRLVESLTVAENIALGFSRNIINPVKEVREKILELSKKYGLKVDPDAYIWQLSTGEKQRVEILKILYTGAKILILDEPTSVLSPIEREALFEVIEKLKSEGCSIIFITHKLGEAMRGDRITVLRRGRVVATLTPNETCEEELAKLMVGYKLKLGNYVRREVKDNDVVLKVEDLWVKSDRGYYAVKGVSFEVRSGEIFGIAGVAGNGQRELVEALTGLRKIEKGRVVIMGKPLNGMDARSIAELGVAHIPEDRINTGLAPYLTLLENYLLRKYYKSEYRNGVFINYEKASRELYEAIREYNIKTPGINVPVIMLSGGNMQKLILARELSEKPRLIIAAHPTYGLDIATTEFVRRILVEERNRGAGILLVSEDLEEVLELSDRVAVMYEGKILGVFYTSRINIEEVGLMMAGKVVKARQVSS